MRGDGTLIAKLDLAWSPFLTASDDHRIFWVQTHEAGLSEETRLQVFDLEGRRIFEQRYREPGATADIPHGGRTYRIKVKDPDLPG